MKTNNIFFIIVLLNVGLAHPWIDCVKTLEVIPNYSPQPFPEPEGACGTNYDLVCQCTEDPLAAAAVTKGCLKAVKDLNLDINKLVQKIAES